MSCCDETTARVPDTNMSRRSLFKGAALVASVVPAAQSTHAQGKQIQLAYCSQILCGVPYEVARSSGIFRDHGVDVQFVYSRGGNAAMQALVGGAVDYAATSLDVAIQAYGKGADIRRFATTGRLPLFAAVTPPARAGEIQGIENLAGRTVGVSALGNADHALMLFLLRRANVDPNSVRFATMGTNLLEAVRQGQVDVGLVQEPALTLIERAGGRVLVNGMDSSDAERFLGGPYEFMGVAVRTPEIPARREEMQKIARALGAALPTVQSLPPEDVLKALPRELTAGADAKEIVESLARHRASLYPTVVTIDLGASTRVSDSLKVAGLLENSVDPTKLFDTSIAGAG